MRAKLVGSAHAVQLVCDDRHPWDFVLSGVRVHASMVRCHCDVLHDASHVSWVRDAVNCAYHASDSWEQM